MPTFDMLFTVKASTLAAAFSCFAVCIDQWHEMTADEKDKHFQAFLMSRPRQQQQPVVGKTVTSTNSLLIVAVSSCIMRKPGQWKRPRTEHAQQLSGDLVLGCVVTET